MESERRKRKKRVVSPGIDSSRGDKRRSLKRKRESRAIGLGEVFHTLVRAGYTFEDLRYKYTIPQVWLFYEEEKKRYLTAQRDLAIVIANAALLATPAGSSRDASEKTRNWKNFINSLDWKELERKTKVAVNPLKALTGVLGNFLQK